MRSTWPGARSGRSAITTRPLFRGRAYSQGPLPSLILFVFGAAGPRATRSGLLRRLLRQLVVDTLDVEVHAQDLLIGECRAALAFDGRAILLGDGTFEGVELA